MHSDFSEVDYVPLIWAGVSNLSDKTIGARLKFYGNARIALKNRLAAMEVYDNSEDYFLQINSLEAAISKVEAVCGSNRSESDLEDKINFDSRNRQFARNTLISAFVNTIKTALQLIMIPILASLLGPAAYGEYSLALPTVLFFLLLADGGLGASMAREEESNTDFWSTAFWMLQGICAFMALMVICSGFILAWISGQKSLIGIMTLLSIALPLLAFSVQADARLARRGNLIYHNIGDVIATSVGTVVVLLLALRGAGAWSLAAQYIANFAVRALILNYFGWVNPGFVFNIRSLRGHLTTSGSTLITRFAELLGKVIENSIFSVCFGSVALGYYGFASQISRYACDSFTNPLLGAFFAHSLKSNDREIALMHARLCRTLMAVLLPILSMVVVVSPAVFPSIIGSKWNEAIPFLQILIVPFSFLSLGWLSGQVLLIRNLVQRGAIIQVTAAFLRSIVMTLGFFVSQKSVVVSISALYVAQGIGMLIIIPKNYRESVTSLISDIVPSFLFSIGAASISYVIQKQYPVGPVGAIIAGFFGITVYCVGMYFFAGKGLKYDINQFIRLVAKRFYSFSKCSL